MVVITRKWNVQQLEKFRYFRSVQKIGGVKRKLNQELPWPKKQLVKRREYFAAIQVWK